MGYLVLQPKPGDKLDIIDGQQRMTTLSLLVLSAMRKLRELKEEGADELNNEKRLDELRRTYIGQLDTVTLQVSSKLSLNRNNDHYYQTYLTTLRAMPLRGFKPSEHLMRKATEWFQKKIGDHIASKGTDVATHGSEVARLIDSLSRGLFFTVITVDDELNAYKVFETLNARGVKLAAPDLLKNYLFSIISRDIISESPDAELDKVEERWSDVLDRLQSDNITSYLRSYWGAKNEFVRQAELFKVIKKSIDSRHKAYNLISGLEDGLETYLALTQPDLSDWTSLDKQNANLLKMFSVRQPFALLMAAKEKVPGGFSQILTGIVNITMRYNVISNLQAAEQERTYSRVATAISRGELKSASDVLSELRPIYPGDAVFKANFESKSFDTTSSRNKQIVKYILAKLDAQISGSPYNFPPPDLSVEHILPESPGENWPQFDDASAVSEVYRLGNMALLEDRINRDIGNKPYKDKCEGLGKSTIASTKKIPNEYSVWDEKSVEARQKAFAKVATSIWRVSQLH